MADQKVTFVLDADEAGVVRAWMAAKSSVTAYEAGLAKLNQQQLRNANAASQMDKEQAKLQASAKRFLQEIQSPQEKYNAKLKELKQLSEAGMISQKNYAEGVRAARSELLQANGINTSFLQGAVTGAGLATAAYAGIKLAIDGITSAIGFAAQKQTEFIKLTEDAGRVFDKASRSFSIQANLTPEQQAAADKSVVDVAIETGFSREKAGAAASALASSGFDTKEATGGTLRAVLQSMNAQDLRGEDPGRIAESVAKYLNANGLEKTEENVRSVIHMIQSWGETSLKMRDLPEWASVAGNLAGKVSVPEQVATAAVLSDTLTAGEGATQTKAVVSNLAGTATRKDRTEALAKLDLKPEDVDFVGESLTDVMGRLKKGLAKLSESEANNVLTTLVEPANMTAAQTLLRDVDKIRERAATSEATGADLFTGAERKGSTSRDAAEERLKLRQQRALAEKDQGTDLLKGELMARSLERGDSPVSRGVRETAFDLALPLTTLAGGSAQDAAVGAELAGRAAEGATSSGAARTVIGRGAQGLLTGNRVGAVVGLAGDAARGLFGLSNAAGTEAAAAQAAVNSNYVRPSPPSPSPPADARLDPQMDQQNEQLVRQTSLLGTIAEYLKPTSTLTRKANLNPPPPRPSEALGDRGGRP